MGNNRAILIQTDVNIKKYHPRLENYYYTSPNDGREYLDANSYTIAHDNYKKDAINMAFITKETWQGYWRAKGAGLNKLSTRKEYQQLGLTHTQASYIRRMMSEDFKPKATVINMELLKNNLIDCYDPSWNMRLV